MTVEYCDNCETGITAEQELKCDKCGLVYCTVCSAAFSECPSCDTTDYDLGRSVDNGEIT